MITLYECKLQQDTVQVAAQKAKRLPPASATAWSLGLSSCRFIFRSPLFYHLASGAGAQQPLIRSLSRVSKTLGANHNDDLLVAGGDKLSAHLLSTCPGTPNSLFYNC